MLRFLLPASAALIACAVPARAQVNADPLSQCMTAKTTAADRTVLVQWVFVGLAQSDVVKSMANIPDARREAAMKGAARVLERLLTEDCRAETVAKMKAGGADALKESFAALGERAIGDIVQDPKVAAVFAGIAAHVDMTKIVALVIEAGAFDK